MSHAIPSVLLINVKFLVNALHLDSAVVGDDAHEACPNVTDVVVFTQVSDMVLYCSMCIMVSGSDELVETNR